MTDSSQPMAGLNRLFASFGDWLQYRRSIREAEQFDSGEFHRIADELGVTSEELGTLVRKGPHAADELPKLLASLGIDAEAVSRVQPMVFHDMERVCARCVQKGRCDRDLHDNTSAQHYEEYCLNAQTIDALAQKSS